MSGPFDRVPGSGFPFEIMKQVSGPARLLGNTPYRAGLPDDAQVTVTQMVGTESGTTFNLVQGPDNKTIGVQPIKPPKS